MSKLIAVASTTMIALALATVATASSVKYDYDKTVDFSKWQNAAWRTAEAGRSSMETKRLERAIEGGFQARGYTLVTDPSKADFLIAYRAAAWQDVRVNDTYHGPMFGRSLSVDREMVGALVIDVFDRSTGELAWHGVVSDALADDPEKADKKVAKAVGKLLEKFPTRGGGR